MTIPWKLCGLLFLLSLLVASNAGAIVIEFRADMDAMQAAAGAGTQCPPASGTPCSGTATANVTFDTETNVLAWEIGYQGLSGSVTNAHFHGAALPGAGAGARVTIPVGPSPIVGQFDLDDPGARVDGQTALEELLDGLWYLNLHTAQNRGGEIRGQVLPVSAQSPLARGDIVVLDQNTAQVVKIDPSTGQERVLSAQVALDSLSDVTVTPDGGAYAIDLGDRACLAAARSVVRIDTRTGRSEVALSPIEAKRVSSDGLGRLYLLSDFVTRFDPATGALDALSYLGGRNLDIAVSDLGEIFVLRDVGTQFPVYEIVQVDAIDGSLERVAAFGGVNSTSRALAIEVSPLGSLIVLASDFELRLGELLALDLQAPTPISHTVLTSGVLLTEEVQDLAIDDAGQITVMQGGFAELVRVTPAGAQSLTGFDPLDGPFLDAGPLVGGLAIAEDGRAVRALANCLLGDTGLVLSSFDDASQSFVTSRGLLNTAGLRRLAVSQDGRDVFVSARIDAPEVEIYRVDPGLGQQQPVSVQADESIAGSTIFDVGSDGRLLFPSCDVQSLCNLSALDPDDPTAPLDVVASGNPLRTDVPLDVVVAQNGFVYHLGISRIPIRVDPETGEQLGGIPTGDSNPLGAADRIAVTIDGQIYVANDSQVARTGLSGFSSIVGIGGLLHDLQAIAAGPSGELYALTPTTVVLIDPARNPAVNQTLIASLPNRSLLDIAVVIPAPSGTLGGLAALSALTLIRAFRLLHRPAERARSKR